MNQMRGKNVVKYHDSIITITFMACIIDHLQCDSRFRGKHLTFCAQPLLRMTVPYQITMNGHLSL